MGATDCSGSLQTETGVQLTSCIRMNSTASSNLLCSSTTACSQHIYSTADCTGADSIPPIEITTDGNCHKIDTTEGVQYGAFKQVDLATVQSTLTKPYMGMWADDATCTGGAFQYLSSGCNHYGSSSSEIQCSPDGTPQSCYWTNSTTCGVKGGRCSPMTGYDSCMSIPNTKKNHQICLLKTECAYTYAIY